MQRLGDMLHAWWASEREKGSVSPRGAQLYAQAQMIDPWPGESYVSSLPGNSVARRVRHMTTNNDYRIVQLTAQLISWEAETPDDEYTPQDKAKIFVQGVLDEDFTTPAQADDEPSRWVWEIVELLGYGPDLDRFEAHQYISDLIDECDFFND